MSDLHQVLYNLAQLEIDSGRTDAAIFAAAMQRANGNSTLAASHYWRLRTNHWLAEAEAAGVGREAYWEALRAYERDLTRRARTQKSVTGLALAVTAFCVFTAFVILMWYSYVGFLRGSRFLPYYLVVDLALMVLSAAILRSLRKRGWTSF